MDKFVASISSSSSSSSPPATSSLSSSYQSEDPFVVIKIAYFGIFNQTSNEGIQVDAKVFKRFVCLDSTEYFKPG